MIEIPGDDSQLDETPDDRPTPNLGAAYMDLIQGLKANALPAETLRRLGTDFSKAAGLDRITNDWGLKAIPANLLPHREFDSALMDPALDLPIDTSHHETARNTERMAETLEGQTEAVAQLVQLTASSLALTTEQREASERSERFSRRTTIISVVIGAASLGTSIAAIVVAIAVR